MTGALPRRAMSAPRRSRVPWVCAAVAAVGLATLGSVGAHDFWIQPGNYRPEPGASTPLTLQVGHAGARRRSEMPLRRITRFTAVDAQGRAIDLRPQLRPGGVRDDGRFQLPAGRYQLVLESDTAALSHLPAARFNAHLEAEGLTPALEHRRQAGLMQAEGAERYGRASKAIVRVGTLPEGDDAVWIAQPVGLPLEIVLEHSPFAWPRPTRLPVRVFHQGSPLAGALVKLGRLDGASGLASVLRTDGDGRASMEFPEGDHWLVTVAWTRVLSSDSVADYETVFSSLTFRLGREEATP